MTETTAPRTSPMTIAVSWLIVGIPLLWGVLETLKKSLALFH